MDVKGLVNGIPTVGLLTVWLESRRSCPCWLRSHMLDVLKSKTENIDARVELRERGLDFGDTRGVREVGHYGKGCEVSWLCPRAALYVDPYEVDDIKDKIERLLGRRRLRAELSEAGKERAKLFNVENYTKNMYDAYRRVV